VNRHRARCCAAVSAGEGRGAGAASGVAGSGGPLPRKFARRLVDFGGWIVRGVVPVGILALLPKCPICLAAYLALGTGIGISLSTAIYLRMALVAVCVAAMTYFAISLGRRLAARVAAKLI
jgi:hypothetical protein